MIATLEVAFRDTRAHDLALTLRFDDVPPRPSLTTVRCDVSGLAVELRVLSGSHEARLVGAGVAVSEVVGCDESPAHGLPSHVARSLTSGTYAFRSTTDRLDPAGFDCAARDLVAELGGDAHSVLGRFPGHPNAMTGLAVRAVDGGVAWRTWHLYPQQCECVRTETRITVG